MEAIASTLQACSYDGNPLRVQPDQLHGEAPADCRSMVDRIMAFTGLPANFVVTAGPVENAVAVIMLDNERIPQRVIAFNPDFIGATGRATGGDGWAAVSIMAHEIGHHLSGHTIVPGGSRPRVELEADKFSGFVLQKMGASLDDATKAILTFGSDHDQPTHPAKDKRAAAISQGWEEACRQSDGVGCGDGRGSQRSPDAVTAPPAQVARVALPAPSAQAIPFKYGRFVVDETGKLDPARLQALAADLRALTDAQGIELALLVVNDLHGMSAEDYAWAMLRQLRVGKLDLGNGGVFVVAPNQGTSGVALAPGVARQLEFSQPVRQFDGWIREFWQRYCNDADGCASSSGGLLNVVESQVRALRSSGLAFKVRFESIQDILDYTNARQAERRQGRQWDDKLDQTIGSLVRFSGTVSELDPKPEFLRVNEATIKDGRWRAVLVKTDDGKETTLYMQPRTEQLMPGGTLRVGQRYTFTGQLKSSGQFHTDEGVRQGNVELWLFSYDPLQ
ncbi:MAG: TPM domain-containing protein [Luteimonas sp.]|nr:TPM domain-containing protein [Luteimonas sp.]